MDNNFIESLITAQDSFTSIVNTKKKTMEKLYIDNKLVAENINYKEYADIVCEAKGYNDDTCGKLFRFFTNFNTTEEDFTFQMTCTYKNGDNKAYTLEGYLLEDGNYIITIKKFIRHPSKTFDNLTKLYTYNKVIEKLKEDLALKKNLIVMLIDLDDFTKVNDIYGFIFGDIVLIETGASIKRTIGVNGYVGRIKADQFIAYVTVPDANYDESFKRCKLIRDDITNTSKTNAKQAKVTASMGSVAVPQDASNLDDILNKASKALSRAKHKGGNCFVIYSELCENEIYKPIVPSENTVATLATDEGKIVAGVFEILNYGGDLKRNLYNAFVLIGTFFQLDRICIHYNSSEFDNHNQRSYVEWINPFYPELAGLVEKNINEYNEYKYEDVVREYRKYITLGSLKIGQIESNKHLGLVYDTLKAVKTSALVLQELSYMGKEIGVIRFENANKNRFWSLNYTSPLLVISKIIAMTIYREIEKKTFETLVTYDKLTGLYNYSKWRDSVEDFIATTSRYPNYSIAVLNVLAFSSIVSKHGATVGDNILKTIAAGIINHGFEGNIYCRMSDDKFILFIANRNQEEVLEVIKGIQTYVKEQFPKIIIRILAGVCTHKGIETVNNCLDNATEALKEATANNEIVIFTDEISQKHQHKAEIELHMKDALKDREFLLYLQPKVNTNTGEVVGAEALTRWNFNFKKLLFPNDFIPIFEENGFITELDYAVFENVCEFQRRVIDLGYTPITISVNVSRYQKNFTEYLNRLNEIRNKYNIESKYLEIELTESMYTQSSDEIAQFIDDLHDNGYFVSMDDFGSGYSNLASLAKLNFDIIKLDKTFCADMNNIKERTILSFIMKLVKDLDIEVLCEGVETKELIENLKKLGCFIVQGYYYSKPIPADDFMEKYIKNKKIH